MTRNYILCTTPRSGSTLLCSLLEATDQAGRPDSFYHEPHFMREWADAWGLADAGTFTPIDYDRLYLKASIARGRGTTAVFGMRLQHTYLAPLVATLARLYPEARSDGERLGSAFGPLRYLHLTRRDKVAQAVSLVKARQSGLWHRNADGSERERTAPASLLAYDPVAIGTEVTSLTLADHAWRQWFADERIKPLRIVYEEFSSDPLATLRHICKFIGLDPPRSVTNMTAGVARLADAINADWVARYRADYGHAD